MARLRQNPNQMTASLLKTKSGTLKRVPIAAREATAEGVRPRFSRSLPMTTRAGPSDPNFRRKWLKKSPKPLT